ncbi:hypothetical protein GX441_03440 [bacterium]|nr:hypothetical protein [bacterium]
MSDLWKEVTSWLAEATRSAIKETEDLALRGKHRFDVLGMNTVLGEKFTVLGGIIYAMLVKKEAPSNIFKDPRVKKILGEIREIETSLKEAKKKASINKTETKTSVKSKNKKSTLRKAPKKKQRSAVSRPRKLKKAT